MFTNEIAFAIIIVFVIAVVAIGVIFLNVKLGIQ